MHLLVDFRIAIDYVGASLFFVCLQLPEPSQYTDFKGWFLSTYHSFTYGVEQMGDISELFQYNHNHLLALSSVSFYPALIQTAPRQKKEPALRHGSIF